jgi:hypothetical protein
VIRNAWLTVVMWSELSGWLYSCDQNCLVDSSHVIRTAFSIHGITCTMKIAIMIYVFFFPTHVLSINFISLIFHYFSMSHFKALFTCAWIQSARQFWSHDYSQPSISDHMTTVGQFWSHEYCQSGSFDHMTTVNMQFWSHDYCQPSSSDHMTTVGQAIFITWLLSGSFDHMNTVYVCFLEVCTRFGGYLDRDWIC